MLGSNILEYCLYVFFLESQMRNIYLVHVNADLTIPCYLLQLTIIITYFFKFINKKIDKTIDQSIQ